AKSVVGRRLKVLDVVDGRGKAALRLRDDTPGHRVRLQAGVLPDDRDDRDADAGKNVDRRAKRGKRAHDHDQQGQHDERVWTPQRDADDTDHTENAPQSRDKSRAPPARHRSCQSGHVAPHQSSYRIVSYFSRSVQLTKALPCWLWGAVG